MTPLLVTAVLAAAEPSPKANAYLEARLEVLEAYESDVRAELGEARKHLEDLREMGLRPHGMDEPIELALLEADLAEASLKSAFDALRWQFERDRIEPPPGWKPWSERLTAAEALLQEHAPDLAKALGQVALRLAPLPGHALAMTQRGQGVAVRGYFAVNATPAEFHAAQLAHESAHLLQGRAGSTGRTVDDEAKARARAIGLWRAIGSPARGDWRGLQEGEAQTLEAGEAAFRVYVNRQLKAEPTWAWVAPKPEEPPTQPKPSVARLEKSARASGQRNPRLAAKGVADVRALFNDVRKNLATAAFNRLKRARELLEQAPEIAAPYDSPVTVSILERDRLAATAYPDAMHRALQAVHPALDALDLARHALGRPTIDAEARARLERYLSGASRAVRRASDPADEAAWAAHEKVHARQGLKDGRRPSSTQELEAVSAAMKALEAAGPADERIRRFMPERAVWEMGGRGYLKLYLELEGWK